MAGVLYNRGKQSRYQGTFKNEVQELLGYIDDIRLPGGDKDKEIYVEGFLPFERLNNIRKAAGMKELEIARCSECNGVGADCICDDLNHAEG